MVAINNNGMFGGLQPPIILAGKALFPPHLMPNLTDAFGNTTASRYYIAALAIPRATTIAGAITANSGAGDNGDKLKMALYAEAAAGGPGARVVNFGEATMTGAAAVRQLAQSATLAAGIYYIALTTDNAIAMEGMGSVFQVSAASYLIPNAAAQVLGGFVAAYVNNSPNNNAYAGDYVDGVYANFPETTSLTPTTSLVGPMASAGASPIPLMGLYW